MDTRMETIVGTIGSTPLVGLSRMDAGLPARVLLKLESRNPGGSVKDRIGRSMLLEAEARGEITPGESVIVEPTSGNTGIALALVGAARGYRVVLAMPESMSMERRKLLRAYGAELVLTPPEGGMQGAVDAAEEIAADIEGSYVPGQFTNPANPQAHYETTGPEIDIALVNRKLGAFVAGVGTGGTISGAGRYLKERHHSARIVAVEPTGSPLITQKLAGEDLTPGPHGIQGIGPNFIPEVLDLGVIDWAESVTDDEAIETARKLASEEGIMAGISSGANVAAALRLAERAEFEGSAVVTFAPSTGERYLSTPLWDGLG